MAAQLWDGDIRRYGAANASERNRACTRGLHLERPIRMLTHGGSETAPQSRERGI
jgi:hypothetical protein